VFHRFLDIFGDMLDAIAHAPERGLGLIRELPAHFLATLFREEQRHDCTDAAPPTRAANKATSKRLRCAIISASRL
jgi:hypothetical protein